MKLGPDWGKIVEEPLDQALVSGLTTLATTAGAVFAGGPVQAVSGATASVAFLFLLRALYHLARWHRDELNEIGFEQMRDREALDKKTDRHERRLRRIIADAKERADGGASGQAELEGAVEMHRKYISDRRSSPLGLILVDLIDPDKPRVISFAGRFDTEHLKAITTTPYDEWTDQLGTVAPYPATLRVSGRVMQLLGVSDSEIGPYDKTLIERSGTHVQMLMQVLEDKGFRLNKPDALEGEAES